MAGNIQYLNHEEVKKFVDELDKNGDGFIDYKEVEHRLDVVHQEIAPDAHPHNLHHDSQDDDARHDFLRTMIRSTKERIPRADFENRVREWKVPSLKQESDDQEHEDEILKSMTIWRRIRAYWAVRGPDILFVALVVSMQLAFGIWQLVKYVTGPQYTAAFGWGVVLAKTCAGALYPTLFFLLLSMSRYVRHGSERLACQCVRVDAWVGQVLLDFLETIGPCLPHHQLRLVPKVSCSHLHRRADSGYTPRNRPSWRLLSLGKQDRERTRRRCRAQSRLGPQTLYGLCCVPSRLVRNRYSGALLHVVPIEPPPSTKVEVRSLPAWPSPDVSHYWALVCPRNTGIIAVADARLFPGFSDVTGIGRKSDASVNGIPSHPGDADSS